MIAHFQKYEFSQIAQKINIQVAQNKFSVSAQRVGPAACLCPGAM